LAVTACFPDDAKNAILGFAISDVLKDVIQSDTLIKQSLYDQFEKKRPAFYGFNSLFKDI
jgi:hypothetical protein